MILKKNTCNSIEYVVSLNPAQARCTRYNNIMW